MNNLLSLVTLIGLITGQIAIIYFIVKFAVKKAIKEIKNNPNEKSY